MKKKLMKLALGLATAAAVTAALGTYRLTSISIEPEAATGPTTNFATETFSVDLPEGFKPYLVTYALYWPDGRIVFEEMAVKWPIDSLTTRMRDIEPLRTRTARSQVEEAAPGFSGGPQWFEDLYPILGRPAVLVFDQAASDDGSAIDRGRPLIMEVHTGDGWLRFFEALASDAPNWNPELEGTPERYAARREKFISRVGDFLDHYFWTGGQDFPVDEEAGRVYKTRHGQITKRGDEGFIFSIALARFIDDDRRMSLNIDARQGYYDWDGLQLCEADRLTRVIDQINLTGTAMSRTNCRQFPVGGRLGYEMMVSEGFGSPEPGSSYLLDWQEDWTRTKIGNFLISFYMTSPTGGTSPDSPEIVLGQWRAMLDSVRFAPLPWDRPAVTASAN